MVVTDLKKLKEVSIKDIIEAIEGPVALTKCIEVSEKKCNLINSCVTIKCLDRVNNSVLATYMK